MAEYRDQTLSGDISLDGNSYVNIIFENAVLEYKGGQPPSFAGCRFRETDFSFSGPAGNTLRFLNAMAPQASNMRHLVLGLIPALKS